MEEIKMAKYETWEILQMMEEEDVKFIRMQFVDIWDDAQYRRDCRTDGKGADWKVYGRRLQYCRDKDMGYDKVCLKPDLDTFTVLPWRPQQGKVARFLCDLMDQEGREISESSRYILKKVMDEAGQEGDSFNLDPECEFFLFETDEEGNPTTRTREKAGYLDVAPLDQETEEI